MLVSRILVSACCSVPLLFAADAPSFENTVQPILTKTCTPCHNQQLASGGMVIAPFTKAASLTTNRSDWERILDKLRAGEMPPRGIPRPPQLDAAIAYVQHQFELADKDVICWGWSSTPKRVFRPTTWATGSITSATC
jgi:hypothetical protein